MALELKESINYAIADLNHWLGIDIGQYLTNDEKAKGILHWQSFFLFAKFLEIFEMSQHLYVDMFFYLRLGIYSMYDCDNGENCVKSIMGISKTYTVDENAETDKYRDWSLIEDIA